MPGVDIVTSSGLCRWTEIQTFLILQSAGEYKLDPEMM